VFSIGIVLVVSCTNNCWRRDRLFAPFRAAFIHQWWKARVAAGCPGRIPHDFRRTAVRNLVRAGVPERAAMQLTGHKTRAIFERYNITSPADLRAAAQRLDAFAAGG
jgi:integrase